MFSSNRRVEPAAPTPPAERPSDPVQPASRPEPAPTGGFLSSGVSITGTVSFQKELTLDCEIDGSINATGRLTIGKQAIIRGEVRTKSVVVDGTVEGNINAAERCELRAGCTVNGDIEAPRLVVDEAATFIGSAKIATRKIE
ncbi:MAG: polymer-forming cytoskeletal protein [Chthoniobacterales bacterium]